MNFEHFIHINNNGKTWPIDSYNPSKFELLHMQATKVLIEIAQH